MARCTPFIWAGLLIAAAASAKGDGTITSGTASLTWHNLATSATEGNADFQTAAAASDQIHQLWWWYRVDSGATPDTREYPFPAPDVETYLPSRSTFTWNSLGPADSEFRATIQTVIYQYGPHDASLYQIVDITNLGASPLTIEVFFYLDPDVGGTPGGDSFSNMEAFELIYNRADDGGDWIASARGPFHAEIPVNEGHTGTAEMLLALNDDAVNTYLPSRSPEISGDVAWGATDSLVVPPGATNSTLSTSTLVNTPLGAFCWLSCAGDLNGDNVVNGKDIAQFVRCAVGGTATPGCTCADMNFDDAIDTNDLAVFVPKLLGINDPNPNCP